MPSNSPIGRIVLTKKEIALGVGGTALALGGLRANDPYILSAALFISWAAFVFLFFVHRGPVARRVVGASIVSLCFALVGSRLYWVSHRIDPRDKIVAQRLHVIISHGMLAVQGLISEDERRVLGGIYPDMPGTNYPDPKLLDSIIGKLRKTNFLGKSDTEQNHIPLTWVGSFHKDLVKVHAQSQEIVTQFNQQDGRLIELAEQISNSSNNLGVIFQTVDVTELRTSYYANGLPEQPAEFFRYYFLILMKTHRVIREFGVED